MNYSEKREGDRLYTAAAGAYRMKLKEQLIQLGERIWNASRTELYISMRFLDLALNSLDFRMNLNTRTAGTDGVSILYNPYYVIERYKSDPVLVNRSYLHMLLHCLFRHMMQSKERDMRQWNLACDIAVESILDGMEERCIHLTVSDQREEVYEQLRQNMKVLTADGIYHFFQTKQISEGMFAEWREAFREDDHSFWEYLKEQPVENPSGTGGGSQQPERQRSQEPDEEKEQKNENSPGEQSESFPQSQKKGENKPQSTPNRFMTKQQQKELEDRWKDISERMETELQTFQLGEKAGELKTQLHIGNRESMDYKKFLQRFAVTREEMQLDMDSFDLGFYTYGMQLYGNMPFIEPYEFQEMTKIEEFVIAIDTSGSCREDLIQKFLEETYQILKGTESFFKKVMIHIVECDAKIQRDEVIHSVEDLKRYQENFTVQGFGGTDFRPVFEYIYQLQQKEQLTGLKGLLYFTDGIGIYPKKKPPYDTAFIFFGQQFDDTKVPAWAMKLVIDDGVESNIVKDVVLNRFE